MTIPHYLRRLIIFSYDALIVIAAWLGAYGIRFNFDTIPLDIWSKMLSVLPLVFCCQILSSWYFGLYLGVWRFASMEDLKRIIKCITIGTIMSASLIFLSAQLLDIPRSIFVIYPILLLIGFGGGRFAIRFAREKSWYSDDAVRVLIVGAGQAGEGLVRDMLRQHQGQYKPVIFVDDALVRIGQHIHGLPVNGSVDDIPFLVKKYAIHLIMIAVPKASHHDMRRIVSRCEQTGVPFHTLPNLHDLAQGRVSIQALRQVAIEDLLCRAQVSMSLPDEYVLNKRRVLITGAGGSIGSELVRQLLKSGADSMCLVDHSEYNLYRIEHELQSLSPNLDVSVYLADISDYAAMQRIITKHKPHDVFHSAAYKHVPMLEHQVRAAMKNNVYGTHVLSKLSAMHGVEKFILISTDKAVYPSSIMGATKRVAELLCRYYDQSSDTNFFTVRFGNVLGSVGSVLPLFHRQLEAGGPMTVTHPDMERYFMTIQEAAQLIVQAAFLGDGGEIFVLDMGEPVNITYLAELMIQLAGKKAHEEIAIEYTGLRPGEKLQEILFYDEEKKCPTSHAKISHARCDLQKEPVEKLLQVIEEITCLPEDKLYLLLKALVPSFAQMH